MELNECLKYDNEPILRETLEDISFPVSQKEQELIDEMVAYIDSSYDGTYRAKKIVPGVAIAANQVGLNKKVVYIHTRDLEGREYKFLWGNPKIIFKSETITYLSGGEGCLSVKEHHEGNVKRHYVVIVEANDMLNGNKLEKVELEGFLAIVAQHEIDHLSGVLYYDRINKEDPMYAEKEWIKIG
ncbi:MAG: peptide deformylase [Mycoplasmataceae bacterium]|nr:peptide deformylase [Mycoplasmataceae bacterium]